VMKSDEILIKTFDQVKNDNFDQVKFDQVIVCRNSKPNHFICPLKVKIILHLLQSQTFFVFSNQILTIILQSKICMQVELSTLNKI
jgi:hypothetical protein